MSHIVYVNLPVADADTIADRLRGTIRELNQVYRKRRRAEARLRPTKAVDFGVRGRTDAKGPKSTTAPYLHDELDTRHTSRHVCWRLSLPG